MTEQDETPVKGNSQSTMHQRGAVAREPRVEDLSLLSRRLYVEGPYLLRMMMHYRIVICPFERLIPHVSPNASVLDIGCGAGLFLALLAGSVPGITGVGFDSSRLAIETAMRMAVQVELAKLQVNLCFFLRNVGESWPEGLFDVVSLVDVMHHVPQVAQKSLIEKAIQKVKPGGVLLYKDMANQPVFHALMNRIHDLVLARQWIHYLPIHTVDEWVAEFGLTMVHAESAKRLWYHHEMRVYRKPQ
jgi:2-polyprenyl-3-methyl-5-hydroxy-6-metoxy-1,4-benzoquinol methylase